jgi:hypothetical protein
MATFETLKVVGNEFQRVRKYPRYLAWLLRWLQRRCKHHTMKADILEGSAGVFAVRWCETCGAVLVVVDGTPCGNPRLCEPTWEK